MPKGGPSRSQWVHRLKLYASKEYKFSTGQHPSKDSLWGKEKERIDKCPLSCSSGGQDLFGNSLSCVCSYHQTETKPPVGSPPLLLGEVATNKSKIAYSTTPTKESTFSLGVNITTTPSPPASTTKVKPSIESEPLSSTITSASTATSPVISPSESKQCPESPPKFNRQAVDFVLRLPKGWVNIDDADKVWIGRYVFSSKGVLSTPLRNWYHPPTVSANNLKPVASAYHLKNFFLWMPRKMWGFQFTCALCKKPLRSRGLYAKVRRVLDLQDHYYLATEYLDCICGKTYTAWDSRLLDQLPYATKCKFPASLTLKYAVDKSLLTVLRSRTVGNSPTAVQNTVFELHSENWMKRSIMYMQDCVRHNNGIASLIEKNKTPCQPIPDFLPIPTAKWFLSVYAQDVMARADILKGNVTSVFGHILKIDSTKKILRKLAGDVRGSASWVTNVGNEYGGILQCVVTSSEANESLQCMADGIVSRYRNARVEPPQIIYTDRDCCNSNGPSKIQSLFSTWKDVVIRLDIWHFMRRIAVGCSSESHPLYGVFMTQLSGCIFEWQHVEYQTLCQAKKQELASAGLVNASEETVKSALNTKEISRHCRRQTRGEYETRQRIEALILEFTGSTDVLGVPLFNGNMVDIWSEQTKHVSCIQDPINTPLYSQTGTVTKGNTVLPVYRCARGSNSLESFHSHLVNFIPGTSANAVNFQAYVLDGLSRWNIARKEALRDDDIKIRTFDQELAVKFDHLHAELFGKPMLAKDAPSSNIEEVVGIEYLFRQSNLTFDDNYIHENIDDGIDSGIDLGDDSSEQHLAEPPSVEEQEDDEPVEGENSVSVDSRGIAGWNKIDCLSRALISQDGISISVGESRRIIDLFNQLNEFDKQPIAFKPIKMKPASGRFLRKKRMTGHADVVAMKRSFVTGGSPSLPPTRNRLVEAIMIHLCNKHSSSSTITSPTKSRVYQSRWKAVITEYNNIRARVFNSKQILQETTITLFNVNETTLMKWHKQKSRMEELKTLLQGKQLPGNVTTVKATPPTFEMSKTHSAPTMLFVDPVDRIGMIKKKPPKSNTPINLLNEPFIEEPTVDPSITLSNPCKITLRPIKPKPPQSAVYLQPPPRPTIAILPYGQSSSSSTTTTALPKTTYYRRLKKGGDAKERKRYSCRKCGQAMEAPHSQFNGRRYCPYEPGARPYDEWLAVQRELAKKKKEEKNKNK